MKNSLKKSLTTLNAPHKRPVKASVASSITQLSLAALTAATLALPAAAADMPAAAKCKPAAGMAACSPASAKKPAAGKCGAQKTMKKAQCGAAKCAPKCAPKK